MSVKRQY